MTTKRVRINEIAKKLDLPYKEVIAALSKNLGIEVKAHSSSISNEEATKIKSILKGTSVPKKAEPKKAEKPKLSKTPGINVPKKTETKIQPKTKAEPKEIVEPQRPTVSPPQAGQKPIRKEGERSFEPRNKDFRQPITRPPSNFRPIDNRAGQGMPPRRPIDNRTGQGMPKKTDAFKEKIKQEQERIAEQKLKTKLSEKKAQEEKEAIKEVALTSSLTVGEFSEKMGLSVAVIIKELMMSGVLATVNQTIDLETAKKTAKALEYTLIEETKEETVEEKKSTAITFREDKTKLVEKAPVVTIMGHVDHGKTTLLDAIRKTKHKIVSMEAGGITQSIGAYTAEVNGKKIVFVDTPGHSAFTAMRARGAQVTDIVILVVAADDGIMPQTIEAINHAKAAKVPIIIAVNKIDKEGADSDKVLQQLTEYELVPEKWGGNTITVEVSALQALNLDELLEYILLVAEIQELKANPNRPAAGVVIESKLDKGKGVIATFLVKTGTLRISDYVTVGSVGGRVRALIDDFGNRIKKAGPSTPVEILGLSEIPEAGEIFEVVASDKIMKDIINKRKEEARSSRLETMAPAHAKRETMIKKIEGATKELNIIIKATTHGAAEAVSSALQQLETKQIFVKVLHLAVGDISEADVMLASASDAIIIGFGVKEDANALRVASEEGIVIRKYDIIYKMLEDVEQTMLGLLEPEYKEVEIGAAEIRQIFTVGKNVKIAGCYVLEGKIIRNKEAKIIRDNKEIFKGSLNQLKRFKDDVKEVASGYECGISFDKFNDLQEGDIIKVLTQEEIKRHTLV